MILDAEPDIAVVGEAGDGDSGVAMVRTVRPDVVLMDIRMPGTNGIDATAQIVREMPDSRVLILTTFDLDDYVFAALRAGASGFLLKDVRPAELLNAIRTVAAGEAVLAPSATRLLIERFVPSVDSAPAPVRGDVLAELTERERDVFVQIAAGRSNREIAGALHVSEGTVKVHVSRVLAKLGLRDRVQAVILAYESAIVTRSGGA
jgi:DNA-binding NarL/FixJ family response regulator